jgi:hypothetical protein
VGYTVVTMREGHKRRFVRVGAVIVLLGAILPNVTYLGHWTIPGLGGATAHVEDDGHSGHCHGSSCPQQAAYSLPWWADSEGGVVLAGGPQWALAPQRAPSLSDPVVIPLHPPPQYA